MNRLMVMTVVLGCAMSVQAQTVVKHIQSDKSPIATGVWAGDTYYLSGQLPNAITPADAAKGTAADYGDTKTQAASVFAKIQAALKDQGLDMSNVVKMTVFLAADPKSGKLEFAQMNSEFVKYFGTKDQPNKPARSAFQVAALVAAGAALEVEVIAVKSK
jgi:enamine deaminase RidA (YjgF/YER057c/UK114 family)